MSNYTEAVLIGIAAAAIAGFAGAGASMPAAVSSPDPHAAALAVQLEAAAIAVRPEVSGRIAAINFAQDQQVCHQGTCDEYQTGLPLQQSDAPIMGQHSAVAL